MGLITRLNQHSRNQAFVKVEDDEGHTVGGPSLLPALSSSQYPFAPFLRIRLPSSWRSSDLSSRIFRIPRSRRFLRRRKLSLFCSTSAIRRLSSMHFLRYASSTDGGSVGGMVPAATARRDRLLAVFFDACSPVLVALLGDILLCRRK